MNKIADRLSAIVQYQKNEGKVRCLTHIKIKLGDILVAYATLGGRYSQDAAVLEFRKASHRFTRAGGYGTAQVMKLVA